MSERKIRRVALIGFGYWGEKIAKVLHDLGVLSVVVDQKQDILDKVKATYPGVRVHRPEDGIVPYIFDGVVIATPPESHYALAGRYLSMRKHVFVEKPAATSWKKALGLEELAKRVGCSFKVGHIYLHCPGLIAMPRPVGRAELYVRLFNAGGPPSDSTRDLLWAGLPHAVSIALHFLPLWPHHIAVPTKDSRIIRVRLDYWDGSIAYLDVEDYAGVRMRDVELRVGAAQYIFNADQPHSYRGVGVEGHLDLSSSRGKDPLTLEIESFLQGEGVDSMGHKVVKLIEGIQREAM